MIKKNASITKNSTPTVIKVEVNEKAKPKGKRHPKERLRAVPHTELSIDAKLGQNR